MQTRDGPSKRKRERLIKCRREQPRSLQRSNGRGSQLLHCCMTRSRSTVLVKSCPPCLVRLPCRIRSALNSIQAMKVRPALLALVAILPPRSFSSSQPRLAASRSPLQLKTSMLKPESNTFFFDDAAPSKLFLYYRPVPAHCGPDSSHLPFLIFAAPGKRRRSAQLALHYSPLLDQMYISSGHGSHLFML